MKKGCSGFLMIRRFIDALLDLFWRLRHRDGSVERIRAQMKRCKPYYVNGEMRYFR
jgi:hypothetical protein